MEDEDKAVYYVEFRLLSSSHIVRSKPMTKSEAEAAYEMIKADLRLNHFTTLNRPNFGMMDGFTMPARAVAWVEIVKAEDPHKTSMQLDQDE